MDTEQDIVTAALLRATGDITASLISAHKLSPDAIAEVVSQVYSSLNEVQNAHSPATGERASVDIEASITPEYLVCLEDGKKLKMLKRYLKTNYNMTPEEYRKRWNLPSDYPMVAPNYAKRRSELAKDIGLGKQSVKQRKPIAVGHPRAGLPIGKGKLRILKSTDIMTTRSITGH